MLIAGTSCDDQRHINGNGDVITETRQVTKAERIRVSSSFDVEITQGATTSVTVEGDANLLPYVLITEDEGVLKVKTKENLNYSSDHGIKIHITTNKLEQVSVDGSGNVTGMNKFSGADKLKLSITGSGDIKLDVNAPSVDANIVGSGSVTLSGETKEQHVTIAGSGDYLAEELKSENTVVKIVGNGDAKVFADISLDVHVAGSGSVLYRGSPAIKQNITGSGDVKKMD